MYILINETIANRFLLKHYFKLKYQRYQYYELYLE